MSATAEELDRRIVDLMSNDKVEIPPYPATAMRLHAMLSTDTYSQASLAELVGSDQALSAAVLRAANSARLRGNSASVTSLPRAVGMLGTGELLRLATALGIGKIVNKPGTLSELRWALWRQASWSAILCRYIAPLWKLDPDQAFLAGLLHDFGKSITISCLERILKQGATARVSYAACNKVIDRYYVELAQVVSARWKLPDVFAQAMTEHNRELAEGDHSMLALVQASKDIIQILESHITVEAEDLASVRHLDEATRKKVAAELPNLPALLDDLETADLTRVFTSSILDREPAEAHESWAKLDRPIACAVGGTERAYRATEISERALRLRGKGAIPPETLVAIGLEGPGDAARLSATVVGCRDAGGGQHEIEVRPFSLDREQATRWIALFDTARGATTAA